MATVLREWLPLILHYVEPWFSHNDISAGDRWATQVGKELEECHFGIICLTRENINAPWILFESGALSKALTSSSVCPYLIDVEFSDLTGPLSQFQSKKSDKASTFQMIQAINSKAINPVNPTRVAELFEALWPKLNQQLIKIPKMQHNNQQVRNQGDILEELVSIVRSTDQRFRRVEEAMFNSKGVLTARDSRLTASRPVLVMVETGFGNFKEGDRFFVFPSASSFILDLALAVGLNPKQYSTEWRLRDAKTDQFLSADDCHDILRFFGRSKAEVVLTDLPF